MPVLWCLECPDQKPESISPLTGVTTNAQQSSQTLRHLLQLSSLVFPKLLLPTFSYFSRSGRLLAFKVTCLSIHRSMTVRVLGSRCMGHDRPDPQLSRKRNILFGTLARP